MKCAIFPRRSKKSQASAQHPQGEARRCPFSAGADRASSDAVEAFRALQADPDIASESHAVPRPSSVKEMKQVAVPVALVPLNVYGSKHHASADTRALVQSIGGLPTLRRFTDIFYQLCFADPHIDKFIASHADPHGERFASWIAEQMGDGTPWTEERRTREVRNMRFGTKVVRVAHDRSTAHFAAWHSPKREPEKWGQHFTWEDARFWMRLHFWAAREAGMFEHKAFMEYYIRFIGHFVSVYSSKAPPFTRESARWSADPANIQAYLAAGNIMSDVVGQSYEQALAALPAKERRYTGSSHSSPSWPYEVPVQR